jgi:hypothetical protein
LVEEVGAFQDSREPAAEARPEEARRAAAKGARCAVRVGFQVGSRKGGIAAVGAVCKGELRWTVMVVMVVNVVMML